MPCFVRVKPLGADGLHLGDHEVGLVFRHEGVELPIEHGNDLVLVGDLHGRGAGVGVDRDDMLSKSLQGDDHFFASSPEPRSMIFLFMGAS